MLNTVRAQVEFFVNFLGRIITTVVKELIFRVPC